MHRGRCSWFDDYLADNTIYPPSHFRQVFRIPLQLYWIIQDEIIEEEPMLKQLVNGLGKPGHTSHQKILSALRRLASGVSFK